MSAINVYLFFNGSCREAMTFYKDCLGGELTLQTVGESPMAAEWPAEAQNSVLYSTLTNGGIQLFASDGDGSDSKQNNGTFLSLTCDTKEELENSFSSLSAGGVVVRAPHDFFAGTMAVLIDKYGKNWMFYCEK